MKPENATKAKGRAMTRTVAAKMSPELHRLLARRSLGDGVPMGELLVRFAARELGRDDLAIVPRKPLGRRPKASGR